MQNASDTPQPRRQPIETTFVITWYPGVDEEVINNFPKDMLHRYFLYGLMDIRRVDNGTK